MQKRYPALRFIVLLYKLVGVLIFGGAILTTFFSTGAPAGFAGFAGLWLIGGILLGVSTYAGGEILMILIDLEEHVRAIRKQGQRPPEQPPRRTTVEPDPYDEDLERYRRKYGIKR